MTTVMQKIPSGYKQTEIGTIPADWDVKRLGDIADINMGQSPDSKNYNLTGHGIPLIQGNADIKNRKSIERVWTTQITKTCKAGDLIMTVRAPVGFIGIASENSCIGRGVCSFRAKKIEKDFLYHSLIFNEGAWKILEQGSTFTAANSNQIIGFELFVPPTKAEQLAIGIALSDGDTLIKKLEKLIEKKKNIKQGVMQELLTSKLRLPGFSGKWETKKLGEVVDIKKGQLITDSTRIDGRIPVIAGGKTAAYFHDKANRFGKTITISGSGASAGYVAFHVNQIFASDCSTIEESKKYSIEFIYFFLQLMQERIYKMQTGGAQPHIHPNDLNPIPISLPKIEEQKAIAAVLSDMDTEIEKLESQLTKYQNIKQGMMQTLLTGKVRLLTK